jgi:hypothetical protein
VMRTIAQAIYDLIVSNKAITVANTFPVYMRLAGFNALCDEAVMSFEHAMDKYPARLPKARATFIKQIKELRDGYWLDKLGGTQVEYCGACERCSEYVASLVAQGILEANIQVTCTPCVPSKKRLRESLFCFFVPGFRLTGGKVDRRKPKNLRRPLSRLKRVLSILMQHLPARSFFE